MNWRLLNQKGVSNTSFRRQWDKAAFEQKAQDRVTKEEESQKEDKKRKEKIINLNQMEPSKAREAPVNLTAFLNKTATISNDAPSWLQGGFYCEACDCVLRDSQNYLDHINGKKHQRAIGSSLQPERATVEQVRARLKMSREKVTPSRVQDDFEERMERMRREEEKKKQERKDKIKEMKEKRKEEKNKDQDQEVDPDMAAFGLPNGFGTSKK